MSGKDMPELFRHGCQVSRCDGTTGHIVSAVAFGKNEESAELIVRAVNAHDDLVAALKEMLAFPGKEEILVSEGTYNRLQAAISFARAALAKAEGRQ